MALHSKYLSLIYLFSIYFKLWAHAECCITLAEVPDTQEKLEIVQVISQSNTVIPRPFKSLSFFFLTETPVLISLVTEVHVVQTINYFWLI